MSGLKSFELNDEDIPLHFTSESSYLIVAEGEQVLLPCKTNVFSEALVSWYKDDIRIAENLTFSFRLRSASREDAGYYHCVVKTTYGGIRSQKVKLEIGYLDPPSKIKARSFIEVTLDQAVIIWPGSLDQDKRKQPFQLERRNGLWKSVFNPIDETNKALPPSYYLQAVPFPQAIWTINNAPIPSTLNIFVSQLEQAIVLLNIDKEMDSKVIRARLINGYGRANSEVFSQTHIIQVKDPPLNMATNSLDLVLPPKDVSLTLKDDQPGTAVFECVFNARPAHALRVQWFKSTLNGKHEPINPSNVISSSTKMSTSSNSNNNNQIIYKFDTSGLNRTLIISNILPSVIPSDYFQQTNQKGIYSEEYTCHAYLNDYNGNSVFDMNKFMLDDSQFTTSVLSSPSSTNSAINLYQRISPISTTARLKLYLPPKVKFPPNLIMSSLTSQLEITPKYDKLVIIETSASMIIQLPCELDYVGIPKAEIKWLRNGDPIDTHNQEYYQIHINHTLIIKNLKLTDAGIFQCYAYNDVGEDFLNIWLKVTSFAPRLCNSEIIMENITVLKESTTVLTCPIHGAPTPEFKWYKETTENEWTPIHQLYQKYKNSNYSSTIKRKQYLIKEDDISVMSADDKLKSTQRLSNSCVPMGLNELEIYHVDYKSTGLYKCEAVNYLGNQSAFIYVSVYSRTIPVHYLPSSITAFANQSLSIMCSFYIDQNTIAEINWFHGRKESTLSGEKYKKHNNTMLLHETTKDNTKVITNYNLVKSVPIDPVITYFSRDIPQKHKPSIGLKEYGSILHVNSVDVIHQGFYVCEILSPGGNYTLKTELKLYYWIETSDFVEVKKCSDKNSFIQQHELTNLKPLTRYHLKISACNDYECGTFSEVLQVQTLPHELFKTPSLISVTVHQGNKVEISFFSDYIDKDDYYIEQMKGYLVELSCIDPPGCSDLQMYLPLECVMDTERFVDEHFNVNPENTIGNQRCNELNPLENSIFLYSANVNRIPSRIINLMVNTDGRDGLIVEWDAPEKPNGKILQYILHYTEIKPIDSLIDIHHQYDHIESEYNTTLAFMNQRINQSSSYDNELSIHQYPITHHLSSAYIKDSNFIHSIQTRTYDNRKYAGYYSLNRTTYRVHIKSLIHKHIYQIRMFALNTAGLSPVTLQLGITSLLPKLKYQYQYTEKNFIQWINLIHLNKHQEKIFKWLNSTRIQFVSEPVITKINAHNAEFSIEFNLKLDEDISHSIHYNQSTPVVGDFSRTIKLIEKCKWPIKIQKIPLNGYQALSGNDQIDSWNWRIITAYKYTINSSLKLSLTELTKFNVNQGVQLTLSFKLFNLSSSNYYRIEVWQPIGLLFGNYKQIASKILYHSNLSKWFKIDCKPPTVSPSSVSTYMLNIDQMKITWQPLSSEEWNGIPGGYLITVQEAETEHTHSSITTYPNHDHMYNANETVKIQITQSKCGLDYLQIFINDSMAFSYIIGDLKLGSDYMVSIRAASVEIGDSDKWLLGPQTVIQHLSIYKQAKNNEDIRFLTSMRMSKFTPYNLKVSRELDWIVVSWKENIKVECGQLPEGYQSSDSFYENILKLPLKIFFNPNEACYFNGYLRLQLLYIIGQSVNENVEQVTIYLNLEAEKIRHRLLLRKVIPLSKQRKARVLITWIPNINNDKPLFPHTDIFTLKWTRIDPISYEKLSLPFTRLISWPDTNNHILMNNGYAALKSAEKASKRQKYSEYLITVDELLMEATYLFQLIETNFSQPINISVNDEKMCSSKTELLVYVTTVESFQTGPLQRPVTPKIQISHSSFTQKQYENTICPIAKTHLSWPNYLRQLQSNQTTEYSSGFLYTSPVTNYVLHYAEVMNNNFSEDIYSKNSNNFGSAIWKTYQPAPQIDEVNDFLVDGLLPYKMYIFRLAAQTDTGISPFSLPTDILITSPQRPCSYSIKLEFELRSHLHSEISQRSDHTSRRRSDIVTRGYCEYLLLKWKALNYHQWNSQPAINNYNTNNLMTSMVQLSSSFIIIHSGIGCNPIELQYNQIKQMTRSIIMYMNKLNYPILLSKPLLSPVNFLCLSDPIQVLIKCTWEYKEFQGILGFILEVHEYGEINYNISHNSIQTHSIFIKPHVNGVLLHSVSSITQSNVILSGQTIIKPYFYYKTSIHVITTGGHGPKAYFPQSDYKETKINTNIKLHHSTENGCLSGELLCTSQSPPNPPFSLASQWLSRDLIKLEWLQPEQLNGKLVNYRITWSEITFPFKDNQFIDQNSINSKELGQQFTMILKSFETTYTIDQLHENTSYIFKVYARTESKQNDGWSIPNCIYASTSYCWFNSPQIIRIISQHKCDFKTLLKTIDPSLEKFCSFNSPILRRPVVFISSINKTATNPKFENLTRNSLKFHYNKTNINYASTVITILWSEAMSGINSITHILIELRYSWNLNKWYSFTMINSSMRLYTFDFEDLTKLSVDLNKDSKHSFHAMRRKVKSQTTMNEINQEATIRMITAAFTDANVPIDSTTHVAIQFRVSPVNQFQIGLPSQESDWSVIKLKTIATPFYHHWWFIMMLGLCATSIIFILLITLKWNIHRRQQLNKSTFVTEKSDSNVSSSNAFMNDCCLALKLYHSNYLTKTMNNNIQLNGEICEYPNLINSTFHNTRSPETVELTTGIYYTENSNNMLHKNQNPFNLALNNHNWDVLYNTSPEILIAQTDSSLGSKAPSNRTVSTSEVERFDDFTQNYNNCITSQGLINSNQSLYPEINVPIIPSYNFSSPYSLQNNQLITDISNSINNEILLNQNLPSPCNSNKLYIDQISAPYPYSSLQNESIMLNQNNLYKLDTNRTLKFDKSVTPFNQTINSLPSSEYQWNTNHQNGQTHLDQKSYDVELSLTQNHSVYQKFINPINNTSSSTINASFNLADTILNNHNSNQHFYQMNANGDNYIMSKSHIGTYEPENPNYMKYNSLQKKSLNRHSMATDYNRSERVKTNMELNSLPMEYSPLNNDNQSSVNHNGQRLIQDFDFNLLPDHLILNGQVNQTSISNTTVNQISNIHPTGSHNNDVNNDTVQVNENSHFTNTKHLSKQGSIHQSPSPYKNTDLLYNNYNSTMTIVKNNDQDTLSNWDENLEFHITTDLELLTSTEV
ncbi:hypothetical protein Smp_171680 [Schistosoma mansoni]|uniref:hypothetical protein n=1 Tax=Schistosoma mansoni TaxID=6183 RepID=UPI0001A623E2|nr:hypothetical protein Smp_171680 [Schistosoma mansoni]|eukprot:XP_018653848.1 hypothetical protein Smp_171680 [Schistosoma mansoni]